ncbi:aminoacyl-tRNA hydrolase [Canibacter oris]|uniref:Peptidyl-tRNA hydrolase n=1 Tax=Canibacter oris TaxID=1365628 RepID=A0A840DHW3_9MICO|nr:aminoacyl-tRNA hydrolase [Canibacter oris]MBB4071365.1 PTH1 family peptidyl-tRNA hydrolase [Canibacter oris]
MSDTWLVVGLGNPGSKYEATRHNIGEIAVDELARQCGVSFSSHRSNNQIASGWVRPGGAKLVLAKPNSYMNTSGGPVAAAAKYFDIAPERIIVLHDELDIPFDTVRLKQGGGHGGHNGLRDIAKALGAPNFVRVRIGIGRPPGQQDVADFVLSRFSKQEAAAVPLLVRDAVDAVITTVESGLVAAQQEFHSRGGAR